MNTARYCSLIDVNHRLSADGVALRVSDDPTAADTCLDEAAAIVEEYCLLAYSSADLQNSRWVKYQASAVAAGLYCERRGNPVPNGLARKWDRAIEKFERVQLGRLLIPDIAARKDAVPVLSNMHVRQDYAGNRSVVERARSTGAAEGYKQRVDLTDPLEWFDPGI